jgi:hypothetical protein
MRRRGLTTFALVSALFGTLAGCGGDDGDAAAEPAGGSDTTTVASGVPAIGWDAAAGR